ncbi:U2 small nuclear ribonucleoprotein auxiliary factor 35 kDa subunit-related protein 2 [Echinococcus granulosus]|nr:U2 small nuclear ribonucleoprotein auxiliary factor 35 kDa subunit-related protein 2 [Echinococcus granulosus]
MEMDTQCTRLSHKQQRKLRKKLKRQCLRQKNAQLREANSQPEEITEEETARNRAEEELEKQRHDKEEQKWLERERVAQELFAQKKALEEAEKSRKILEETVEIQEGERIKIGTPINGKTQSEVLQRLRDGIEESSDNLPPYHRPEPPLDHSFAPPLESTSRIKELCSFFWKTGACIYGDGCSRFHPTPPIDSADLKVLQSSVFCPPCLVLILENMFDNFSLRYDPLEVDESHLQSDYEVFYEDVRPEIEVTCGKISALRCCRNAADHLRGNVYIQLTGDDTTAITAAARLNGRWYAGRQITARLAYLGGGWKAAVCGLYLRDLCPKGDRRCNFLHLFLNPRESSGDLLAALSRGLAELPSRRKEKRRASRKKNQDKDSDGHRRKRRRSPSSRSDSGRRHRNRQKKRHHRRKRG